MHSGPASWPQKCDCGGFRHDSEFSACPGQKHYTPALAIRNFLQLWKARTYYVLEKFSTLFPTRPTPASNEEQDDNFYWSPKDKAQQFDGSSRKQK